MTNSMLRHLLLNLLCISHFSYADIYQTCKWSNQPLTDRFIQFNQEFLNADDPPKKHSRLPQNHISWCHTGTNNRHNSLQFASDVLEADPFLTSHHVPMICFLSSMAKNASNNPPSHRNSLKSYYHCNSPNDVNPINYMSVKQPKTNQKTYEIYLRPPCISKNYHLSVVKTFNKMAYCFNLSNREVRNLFAIINHESHFTANAKSPTGARCAGQLTKPTVITLGVNILQQSYPTSHLYDSAISRCPSLIDKTIPSDIRCTKKPCSHSHLQTGKYDSKIDKLSKYPVTCKLTSDLPQCFLYTFLNFTTALKQFDQNFDFENEFENQEISDDFIQKYGTGLNVNEIIIAKKENSSNINDIHLFTSAQSAYKEVQKYGKQNPMYDLDVQIVSIISTEDIESFKFFVVQLSYNGGKSIARSQVRNFLTFLKEQMDQADCPSPNNKYCSYRRQLLQGSSLSLSSIKEDFKDYLRQAVHAKSGKKKYPREEIFRYPDKIQKSIDYFQNSNGLSQSHLKKLASAHLSTNKVSPETAQQIRNTAEEIKNQCQIQIP